MKINSFSIFLLTTLSFSSLGQAQTFCKFTGHPKTDRTPVYSSVECFIGDERVLKTDACPADLKELLAQYDPGKNYDASKSFSVDLPDGIIPAGIKKYQDTQAIRNPECAEGATADAPVAPKPIVTAPPALPPRSRNCEWSNGAAFVSDSKPKLLREE